MAEKLRRRPMPATLEQRQFKIGQAGQVVSTPVENPEGCDDNGHRTRREKQHLFKRPTQAAFRQGFVRALYREAQFDAPFLWCVICVAAGCLIYFTSMQELLLQPILFGLAFMVTMIALAQRRPTLKTLVIYMACIVSGILLSKVETLMQPTQMLGSEVNTTVSAHVLRFERLASGRKRLLLHVEQTREPKLNFLSGRLRLTYRGEADYAPGDFVTGRARLFPPSGPVKPGGFDFSYQSYFSDLAATGIFFGAPEKLADDARPLRSFNVQTKILIEQSRQAVENRIKNNLTGPNGDLASALVTGRKSAISDETNEALRATGLAHILSISGLHMVLAAGSALFAVRFILALFPAFSMMHNARKIAAIISLGVATLYLAISGAGIATQRSYIMLAIILVALLCDRQALTMRNLAIAALLVLMVHPHEILNAGFHMSFAATAALIAAYGALRTQRYQSHFFTKWQEMESITARLSKGIFTFFGGLALTALIAGFATGLYSIYHFERFAPYGILANVVAMPIVTAVIMPSALLAMLLSPFDLDFYAWKAMGLGIDYVVSVANTIANVTPYKGTGAIPTTTIVAGTMTLIFVTALRTRLALLGVLPLLLAIITAQNRILPKGYIHENGKTVGVLTETGNLALNRNRVSSFVTDQWQRSLMAEKLSDPYIKRNLPTRDLIAETKHQTALYQFRCNKEMCLFGHNSGIQIATVKTYESLEQLCVYLGSGEGQQNAIPLIIYEHIRTPGMCAPFETFISNAQQRAFKGAIAFYADDHPSKPNEAKLNESRSQQGVVDKTQPTSTPIINRHATTLFRLEYSFQTIERPWHRHRAYSRAARNIETY